MRFQSFSPPQVAAKGWDARGRPELHRTPHPRANPRGQGARVLLAPQNLGSPQLLAVRTRSRPVVQPRALPSLSSLSCPPLPSPPIPAQPRTRVCYCEGARGEDGGGVRAGAGACPWAPRWERAVRAAGRGGRGGARHPPLPRPELPNSDWLPAPGARESAALRAGRGARAAPPAASEERREEGGGGAPGGGRGEGGGARPAPCKAALFIWAQSQPPRWEAQGGPSSPTGELFLGRGRGGRPGWGAGCGRALPARPAPRPPPRFTGAHAKLPITGGRPANSVA